LSRSPLLAVWSAANTLLYEARTVRIIRFRDLTCRNAIFETQPSLVADTFVTEILLDNKGKHPRVGTAAVQMRLTPAVVDLELHV
jgi:hypothetical protein